MLSLIPSLSQIPSTNINHEILGTALKNMLGRWTDNGTYHHTANSN